MKKITPKLDFTQEVPVSTPLGRLGHSNARIKQNDLGYDKFDEYERNLVEIAAVLDDYEYSTLANNLGKGECGASDTVRSVVERLWYHINDLFNTKLSTSGGTINGNLTINGSTGGGLTVNGRTSTKGLAMAWSASTYYNPGDLVRVEENLFVCGYTSGKLSGSTFASEAGEWELLETHSRIVYSQAHGFTVGTALYYNSGYYKARADNIDTMAMWIVTEVISADYIRIQSSGWFFHSSSMGLIANMTYYLSDATAGAISPLPGVLTCPVLHAVSDRSGYVFIRPPRGGMVARKYSALSTGGNTFTLPYPMISKDYGIVSIQGAVQDETAFDLSSDCMQIVFSENVPSDCRVEAKYWQTLFPGQGAFVRKDRFVASGGVTEDFTLGASVPSKDYIIVSKNGTIIDDNAYTLVQKRVVRLTLTAASDIIVIQRFHSLAVYDFPDEWIGEERLDQTVQARLRDNFRLLLHYGDLEDDFYMITPSGELSAAPATQDNTDWFFYFDKLVFDLGSDPAGHVDASDYQTLIGKFQNSHRARTVYGRVQCSGLLHNQTEIQSAIDQYAGLGMSGVLLDEFGYDNGTSRDEQNNLVEYCHQQNLRVIVSCSDPADALNNFVDATYNPDGDLPSLGEGDAFLSQGLIIDSVQYPSGYNTSMGLGDDLKSLNYLVRNLGVDLYLTSIIDLDNDSAQAIDRRDADAQVASSALGCSAYGIMEKANGHGGKIYLPAFVCADDFRAMGTGQGFLEATGKEPAENVNVGPGRYAHIHIGMGSISFKSNLPVYYYAAMRTALANMGDYDSRIDAAELAANQASADVLTLSGQVSSWSSVVASISGKVDKTGDTMTGALNTPAVHVDTIVPYEEEYLEFRSKSGELMGVMEISSGDIPPSQSGEIHENSKFATGAVFVLGGADLAEYMPSNGKSEPGDLLQVSLDPGHFVLEPFDGSVGAFAGIHAERPAMIMGKQESPTDIPVALTGLVWIKTDKTFYPRDTIYLTRNGLANSREVHNLQYHFTDCRLLGTVAEFSPGRVRIILRG